MLTIKKASLPAALAAAACAVICTGGSASAAPVTTMTCTRPVPTNQTSGTVDAAQGPCEGFTLSLTGGLYDVREDGVIVGKVDNDNGDSQTNAFYYFRKKGKALGKPQLNLNASEVSVNNGNLQSVYKLIVGTKPAPYTGSEPVMYQLQIGVTGRPTTVFFTRRAHIYHNGDSGALNYQLTLSS